jgi:short subunit dehydrogenase-like uncharacterized protein
VTDFDVVLYGATGFTGAQTARYFDRHVGTALRWAIAGRSAARLEALQASLQRPVPVVVADAHDEAAIDRLVAGTRVVLTTAGPYARYGEGLLRACVTRGVDYVDITGETLWVRRMIDRYHDRAVLSGARIVPFCGFDSVPADLGAHLLVEHFRRLGLGTRSVKGFYRAQGGINGGTVASLAAMMNSPDRNRFDDPLLLNPEDSRDAASALANRDPVMPTPDVDLGHWVAPFFMGPINTRVVRRSAALAAGFQRSYGLKFSYQEYLNLGSPLSFMTSSVAALATGVFGAMSRIPGVNRTIETLAPAPGEGPSETTMDEGFFECFLVGRADDGSRAWARIEDKGDPGNRATVKFVCESALCLARERDRLPNRAGLLTPAVAFGDVLVERLRAAGMRIECPTTPPAGARA